MKDSHQVLVVSSVSILIGIILIGLSRSNIPSADNPFLSVQAFFTMGFIYFGFSLGLLGAIGYIFKLEKKKEEKKEEERIKKLEEEVEKIKKQLEQKD